MRLQTHESVTQTSCLSFYFSAATKVTHPHQDRPLCLAVMLNPGSSVWVKHLWVQRVFSAIVSLNAALVHCFLNLVSPPFFFLFLFLWITTSKWTSNFMRCWLDFDICLFKLEFLKHLHGCVQTYCSCLCIYGLLALLWSPPTINKWPVFAFGQLIAHWAKIQKLANLNLLQHHSWISVHLRLTEPDIDQSPMNLPAVGKWLIFC